MVACHEVGRPFERKGRKLHRFGARRSKFPVSDLKRHPLRLNRDQRPSIDPGHGHEPSQAVTSLLCVVGRSLPEAATKGYPWGHDSREPAAHPGRIAFCCSDCREHRSGVGAWCGGLGLGAHACSGSGDPGPAAWANQRWRGPSRHRELGSLTRPEPDLPDGRLCLDVRDAGLRDRHPRSGLCPLLPVEERPGAAVLCLPHGLYRRHGRDADVGQYDALYIATMLLFIVTGMRLGTPFLFEAALVIAVGGFVGTVSLAKFLLRGEVIE